MTTYKTAQLGDLVVAAFDKAARYSRDQRKVSRLATRAVARMLRRARRTLTPLSSEVLPRSVLAIERRTL